MQEENRLGNQPLGTCCKIEVPLEPKLVHQEPPEAGKSDVIVRARHGYYRENHGRNFR
jgi:hypothetical protein